MTRLAEVDELRRDKPAEEGVFEGIRAIGGLCNGDGACIYGLRIVPPAVRLGELPDMTEGGRGCCLDFRFSSLNHILKVEKMFLDPL